MSNLSAVRRQAWETRRAKYGPRGHAGSYSRCACTPLPKPTPPTEWPEVEWEEGYPVAEDDNFAAWRGLPFDFHLAAQFLVAELPKAAEHCCAWCEVTDTLDALLEREPVKRIEFSTGGWSGAESLVGFIESRLDTRHFMASWRRGGHYVFEVPTRLLVPRDMLIETRSDETAKPAQPEG